MLSMCARIAAASAARSSGAPETFATKRHIKHKMRLVLKSGFRDISQFLLCIRFCVLCAFSWPAFNNKYASGVFADVNGIAARTGPAILWQRAIATPASLDDCVGSLDCAGRVCSHQSHRAGASARLGTSHVARAVVRVRRLVSLRVAYALCLCELEKVAAHSPASRPARGAALLPVTVVLRRLGHLRAGVARGAGPHLRSRSLSHDDAGRRGKVLAAVWSRMVELDLHYASVRSRCLSLRGRHRACDALFH